MIPLTPVDSSLPFLCPPLLSSPFPLFLFHPALSLTQLVAFASSTMWVGVALNLYLVLSSLPLNVTVHTGVSVQRRDRCTGRQQGT